MGPDSMTVSTSWFAFIDLFENELPRCAILDSLSDHETLGGRVNVIEVDHTRIGDTTIDTTEIGFDFPERLPPT